MMMFFVKVGIVMLLLGVSGGYRMRSLALRAGRLDVEGVKEILPHRFPFLLIDRVLEVDPGKSAVAIKNITVNEDTFNGHFPGKAVFPGVLQVEALAQVAGIIALQPPMMMESEEDSSDKSSNLFLFAGVDGVKWKRPVVPGDTLTLKVQITGWKPKFGIALASGKAYVGEELACQVDNMKFALVKDNNNKK